MPKQYTAPVLVKPDGAYVRLERLPLSASQDQSEYNERWLQELVFAHPECLPIEEIDQSYSQAVPVCMELRTDAGYIDALFVTPEGKLIVLEAKLWRNPEARRKVVGQVLDYAKELSRWSYEDLQREVAKVLGTGPNALFDSVAEKYPELNEASFVDEMSRSLRTGRFMLLIVGDGIREGVGGIASFLQQQGTLNFSFGLIELAIFSLPNNERIVQPRILANTLTVSRFVIELSEGARLVSEEGNTDDDAGPEKKEEYFGGFYRVFWTELIQDLVLDDVSQPTPNIARAENLYLTVSSGGDVWMSAFFSKSSGRVGVYIRFRKRDFGELAFKKLSEEKDSIEEEVGAELKWEDRGKFYTISISNYFSDVHDSKYRQEIKEWFSDWINRFVNAFRHRLKRYEEEA